MRRLFYPLALLPLALVLLTACEEEVGSAGWCAELEAKSKADWSVNDAANYAKHCVIKVE